MHLSRSQCCQIVTNCHSPIRVYIYIFTNLTFILMRYLGSNRIRCNIENKRKYARGSKTFWKGFWSTGLLHPVVQKKMVAKNLNILVLNSWSIYTSAIHLHWLVDFWPIIFEIWWFIFKIVKIVLFYQLWICNFLIYDRNNVLHFQYFFL